VKRLEEIPKKQFFKVPDGYFDELPTRIQSRVQSVERKTSWVPNLSPAWKLALSIVLVGMISIGVWVNSNKPKDWMAALDTVPAEQLLAYLELEEITTEEILENASFSNSTINTLYSPEELTPDELEEVVQQFDFNF
jgi:cobalamin biosynthesis protein CbiG